MTLIKDAILESIKVKQDFINQEKSILLAASALIKAFKKGRKLLICGNGGSAADSQHIAAELLCRFKYERGGLPAISLTTDTSIITAWSNDYAYNAVFERQVEALAKAGDILLGISTSGNSENVIKAFIKGKKLGMINISLTGKDGGKLKPISDININVSSQSTPRIQECHMLAYHIICELVDEEMIR